MARSKKKVEVEAAPEQEITPVVQLAPRVRVTWRSWGAWATTFPEGERVRLSGDTTYELVDETTASVTLKVDATGQHVTLPRGMVERI